MPPRRGRREAQGGANDADGARGAPEAERRAQELGAAMLNAARPYMDVTLSKAGYPLAILPRDFFSYLESHTAYNHRTPAVLEKVLALDGISPRVITYCLAFSPESQARDAGRGRRGRAEGAPGIRSGLGSEDGGGPREVSAVGQRNPLSQHFGSSSRSGEPEVRRTMKRCSTCST